MYQTGIVDERQAAVGNVHLLHDLGIAAKELAQRAEQMRADGQTAMLAAIDDKPAGVIGVADPIKASSAEAVRLLKNAAARGS